MDVEQNIVDDKQNYHNEIDISIQKKGWLFRAV